jgi:succinyl-diaminopimelate desuccinylase
MTATAERASAADGMSGTTMELARQLIAARSVTPADAGCLDIIGARLAAIGFRLERMDSGSVSNLWARRGTADPLFCFAGHTDVVPTGPLEQWHSDPFEAVVRDGFMYGRGAADMKSSLAAFVTATERFVARCPQHAGSIAFLLTSDEEGDATDGTVRVVEGLAQRGERIDWCVIGEPTSVARLGDTIKNGRRGSLSGRLTVHGVQGHIAYPHLARNPVHEFAPALAELAATQWDDGNDHFPPTSWQVSNIRAGTGAGNVIPGTLDVWFNFRFSTASTPDSLKARLAAVLRRHNIEHDIAWTLGGRPFLTPPGPLVDAAVAAIRDVTGVDAALSTSGGTSDGRFIADICDQVVEIGPCNASIHKLNECVAVGDIEPLSHIHENLLDRMLGHGALQ